MLIDDSEIDNYVAQRILAHSGFCKNILVYTSAKAAIEHFSNVSNNGVKDFLPEIIFVDLNMPIVDGFQFLDLLQKTDFPKDHLKVIVLTASLNPADQEKAMKYKQVIGFLSKPLTEETLLKLK